MLFDTDVLIEHLRGNPKGTALVAAAVGRGDAACSVLTRFELLAGMRSGERRAVQSLLAVLANVPVTMEIAGQAGHWARHFRSSHANIGPVDYLIAASVHVMGLELATRNVRYYPMFEGLEPAL